MGIARYAPLNTVTQPVGAIDVALAHAKRLLEKSPELAAEQAREILKAVPGHPHARLILGAAHRSAGRPQAALEVLEPLAREQPHSAPVHLELGVARGEAGRGREAIAALRRALQLQPGFGRCLAAARRPSRCAGRCPRRRPGARALPQGRDQGSAL